MFVKLYNKKILKCKYRKNLFNILIIIVCFMLYYKKNYNEKFFQIEKILNLLNIFFNFADYFLIFLFKVLKKFYNFIFIILRIFF